MIKKGDKKAQITIFIIISILLISAVILLFFLINEKKTDSKISPEENPEQIIKECIEDDLRNIIKKISYQGGSYNPDLYRNFKKKNEEKSWNVSYLCYTNEYYTPCISQEPVLKEHLKNEIRNQISENVSSCFNNLVESLNKKGYEVNSQYNGFNITLFTKKIEININSRLDYEKSDKKITKKDMKIIIPTRFYDLARTAQEISSQESKYCNFERIGYMMFYPDIKIDFYRVGNTKIYNLKHKSSNEIFRFAIRTCATSPGII